MSRDRKPVQAEERKQGSRSVSRHSAHYSKGSIHSQGSRAVRRSRSAPRSAYSQEINGRKSEERLASNDRNHHENG
jgi:hypothetical protein